MDKIFISPYCKYEEVKLSYQYTKEPIIHDTTLREGEQSPGVILSSDDRIKIAEYMVDTKIDCIEAGFPASSNADYTEVKRLAKLGLGPTIYGFARALQSDIDAVIDCGCEGIVLSFPPSTLHIKHKLRITKEQYIEKAIKNVGYAKDHGLDVIYSAEDSTRTELSWLKEVFSEIIKAGVDVLEGECINPIPTQTLGWKNAITNSAKFANIVPSDPGYLNVIYADTKRCVDLATNQ